ncbi:MAG: elongation factor 4 [Candidatus Niyogibacteria bacterium]|nr:elongation factor 4 [Candidatus Niyogibacteria bacterium]
MQVIRNFVIISHIDHGKSTLADRLLELTGTVEKRKMRAQFLDSMELERERGITIKMQPVRMIYRPDRPERSEGPEYILNLIDTPGHIDFAYEVSRALRAVEGAILLVDATQGVQAQTLTVLDMAEEAGLAIIPAVNKIDLPAARIAQTKTEIAKLLGVRDEEILEISGKTGQGVEKLFDAIIERIPAPKPPPPTGGGRSVNQAQALVFDYEFSPHQGVIAYVRIVNGTFKKNDALRLAGASRRFICQEVGVFSPERESRDALEAGEIGYIVTNIKEAEIVFVGDTVTGDRDGAPALAEYRRPQPMIWSSVYPLSENDFDDLKKAVLRLHLSDSSFVHEEESSRVLGRGFRIGFLGMLHFEILVERIRREFGIEVIAATPTVAYDVTYKSGIKKSLYVPAEFPDDHEIAEVRERLVDANIIYPHAYTGVVVQLLQNHEGVIHSTDAFGSDRSIVRVSLPLRELMRDFFDELKSATSGFASLSYVFGAMQKADVVRLDILVHEERVPAFSRVVGREAVEREARLAVEKLYGILPRELFAVKIQGVSGGRILASRTLAALKKDVTGYLYGGDRTRKMKLWQKQKRGKKRMKEFGRVSIPHDVFVKMIRLR